MNRVSIAGIVCVAAVLLGAGCSSDDKGSDTTSPTTASNPTTITTVAVTTITAIPGTTTTAATSVTAGTGSSTTTATTTGGRVVTSPSDSVKLGDTGSGVQQIQTALKAAGYDIEPDGAFGPVTDRAVRDFQKANDLTVDGVVGPLTWAKLSQAGTATTAATTTTTG